MANIFDQGRPTGAMAGAEHAEHTRRKNRDSDLAFNHKQAEFFDYIDAIESRQQERRTGIAENKAKREVLPSETELKVEENITGKEKTLANRELIQPLKKQVLDKIHRSMTEEQYASVTRAYYTFDEGIRSGKPAPEIYAMARAELIRSDPNPEAAEKWLNSVGITQDATEESIAQFKSMSTYGMHNLELSQEEHLLDIEMEARASEQLSARAAQPKATDYLRAKKEELVTLGQILAGSIKGWDKMEGTLDTESGLWTGPKGQMVAAIDSVARTATMDQKQGDPNLAPAHVERMSIDIINHMKQFVIDDDYAFTGARHWGDDFDGNIFDNAARSGFSMVQAIRKSGVAGTSSDFMEAWKANQNIILPRLHRAYVDAAKRAQQKGKKDFPEKKTAPVEDSSSLPKKRTSMELKSDLADVNKRLRSVSKFDDDKKLTPAFRDLIGKRDSIKIKLKRSRN